MRFTLPSAVPWQRRRRRGLRATVQLALHAQISKAPVVQVSHTTDLYENTQTDTYRHIGRQFGCTRARTFVSVAPSLFLSGRVHIRTGTSASCERYRRWQFAQADAAPAGFANRGMEFALNFMPRWKAKRLGVREGEGGGGSGIRRLFIFPLPSRFCGRYIRDARNFSLPLACVRSFFARRIIWASLRR